MTRANQNGRGKTVAEGPDNVQHDPCPNSDKAPLSPASDPLTRQQGDSGTRTHKTLPATTESVSQISLKKEGEEEDYLADGCRAI